MKNNNRTGIFLAILAASFYAISSPLSKLLLDYMPSTLMAGFLYIGAGIGMVVIALIRKIKNNKITEQRLTKSEFPFTFLMIVLDIIAPILLLLGLKTTTAANASLLNNFEIVATAIIALIIFKETISPRLWLGILFVTLSCAFLSFENLSSFKFSMGSLYILLASICWGLENNCTKKISSKDPMQIVMLKGIFSGLGSIIIGFCIGEKITNIWCIFAVLLLGFVAYGLSIFFYVYAQRLIGAARTSAYYAISPFIGSLLSLIIFQEKLLYTYIIALVLMAIGAWLCSNDKPLFKKKNIKIVNSSNSNKTITYKFKKNDIIFIIKKALISADPLGAIVSEKLEDEYDLESEIIFKKLKPSSDANNLAATMVDVFKQTCQIDTTIDFWLPYANNILDKIINKSIAK